MAILRKCLVGTQSSPSHHTKPTPTTMAQQIELDKTADDQTAELHRLGSFQCGDDVEIDPEDDMSHRGRFMEGRFQMFVMA